LHEVDEAAGGGQSLILLGAQHDDGSAAAAGDELRPLVERPSDEFAETVLRVLQLPRVHTTPAVVPVHLCLDWPATI
jgi:hypothetical protein